MPAEETAISPVSTGDQDPEKSIQDEVVEVDPECGKERYSKISVWLMVLYSGLAIGSDG
jgi:hypothetical protein